MSSERTEENKQTKAMQVHELGVPVHTNKALPLGIYSTHNTPATL